jgi:hypothetical protein
MNGVIAGRFPAHGEQVPGVQIQENILRQRLLGHALGVRFRVAFT